MRLCRHPLCCNNSLGTLAQQRGRLPARFNAHVSTHRCEPGTDENFGGKNAAGVAATAKKLFRMTRTPSMGSSKNTRRPSAVVVYFLGGMLVNPVRAAPPEPLDRGSRLGCCASQISSAGGPESRCELRESRPAGASGPQYPHQSRTAPADGPWGHYMHRAA